MAVAKLVWSGPRKLLELLRRSCRSVRRMMAAPAPGWGRSGSLGVGDWQIVRAWDKVNKGWSGSGAAAARAQDDGGPCTGVQGSGLTTDVRPQPQPWSSGSLGEETWWETCKLSEMLWCMVHRDWEGGWALLVAPCCVDVPHAARQRSLSGAMFGGCAYFTEAFSQAFRI